jgi:hypothetical protein
MRNIIFLNPPYPSRLVLSLDSEHSFGPLSQPDGGGAPVDYAALLASLKSASTLPTMSSSIAGEGGVAANALLSAAKALTSTSTAERERLAVQARAGSDWRAMNNHQTWRYMLNRHAYSSKHNKNIFSGRASDYYFTMYQENCRTNWS